MQNDQVPGAQQPAVTISQAEYNALRAQAQAAAPPPQYAPVGTTGSGLGPQAPLQEKQVTKSEMLWFGLAFVVLISIFIPVSWIFFLPIAIFGILASKGFFNDATNKSTSAKGALLILKILAVLGITAFIGIAAIIMFFIAAISFGGPMG